MHTHTHAHAHACTFTHANAPAQNHTNTHTHAGTCTGTHARRTRMHARARTRHGKPRSLIDSIARIWGTTPGAREGIPKISLGVVRTNRRTHKCTHAHAQAIRCAWDLKNHDEDLRSHPLGHKTLETMGLAKLCAVRENMPIGSNIARAPDSRRNVR